MSTLRVALIEDDPQLRAGFRRLVDEAGGMTCMHVYASAEEGLAGVLGTTPQVVLMDINLPKMNGIECVRRLRASGFAGHILMLTAFGDDESIFESLKAGAGGYVLKRTAAAELVPAIRTLADGGAPMTGSIARKVVQFFSKRAPAPEIATLTERERDVLVSLSEGKKYQQIADEHGIALNTVRKHIKSIYEKLQVNSKMNAVSKLGSR